MPIDRNDALRRAEKLLRQGRLDAAIAEYTRIVDEFPRDLATGNLLGDLHLRAGQIDRAVAQYTRVAEQFVHSGFLPRASALYKKILKIRPDDDTALLRMADLVQAQGLVGDARACLQALYNARLRRGDREGAADIAVRRAAADPADVSGRLDAARLLAEIGQPVAAAEQLRNAGLGLLAQGRRADGTRVLAEALQIGPDDPATRDLLVDTYLEAGDPETAAGHARGAAQLGRVARALLAAGRQEAAIACLAGAVHAHPGDAGSRVELARVYLACDRISEALAALPSRDDAEGPETTRLRVEVLARSSRGEDARALIEQTVRADPASAEPMASACLSLAEANPAVALSCLEPVVEAIRRAGDLMLARSVVQRLAERTREPIEVLRLLIDVCDDLADEDGVYHGQVRLTDALLEAGQFAEARVVAELLVAKRPDVAQHRERLREATHGLGPALTAGLADDAENGPDATLESLLRPGPESDRDDLADADVNLGLSAPALADESLAGGSGAGQDLAPASEALSLDPLDDDVRRALASAPLEPLDAADRKAVEIDLSVALNELLAASGPPALAPAALPEADGSHRPTRDEFAMGHGDETRPPPAFADAPDLDGFFQALREESGSGDRAASAARSFDMASAAYNEGRHDEACGHLEQAAKDPAFRFRAGALLARVARDDGRFGDAIEWLERAAQAPAPSAGAWDALIYDLGCTLQEVGETRRALAVFMELQSASPGYRDVDARIATLSAPGTGSGATGRSDG